MIVMGIDPGTIKAGYGVIDAQGSELKALTCGVVRGGSSQKKDYALRIRTIFGGLKDVIEEYSPEEIVIETAFYSKNVNTAIRIGEGRGLALLAASLSDIPVIELSPSVIKKAVTGRGDASKEQVGEMVKLILGLEEVPSPDDVPDALACAIAGYHRCSIDYE